MPELTIASAVSRMSDSSIRHPNLFQLFQPIGGVGARPAASRDLARAPGAPDCPIPAAERQPAARATATQHAAKTATGRLMFGILTSGSSGDRVVAACRFVR